MEIGRSAQDAHARICILACIIVNTMLLTRTLDNDLIKPQTSCVTLAEP